MKLSDSEAKAILGSSPWPARTKSWPIPAYGGYRVRGCPAPSTMPYIHSPGASINNTCPDAMYLFVHEKSKFADVIAIEVCGSNQNFNDKRARYTPTSGNLHVTLPYDWLDSEIMVQKGARKKVWEASCWFDKKPIEDLTLTIRHLRILLVLTDGDYAKFGSNCLPAGHEYFCRHRDLKQYTQQQMQKFLGGLALMKHFKSRPKAAK